MSSVKLRDPVHGFITLEEDHLHLVNSSVFQRLRRIRQLAWADLVYAGATHTRFGHTLGVFHITALMAEELKIHRNGSRSEERRLVEYAALLHDLGHGPFSHVSESVLEVFADRDKLDNSKPLDKIHELLTADIIRQDETLNHYLGTYQIEKIIGLLTDGEKQHSSLRQLISGPLDADKQDYLLRDAFFCGVEYGRFDIHQLHRELRISKSGDDEFLSVDDDGLNTIEQFVMAKYYMTRQVYRHKVRTITDQMLIRALTLGIEHDGIDELRALYAYDGTPQFIENFLQWDDTRLMSAFTDSKYQGTHVHTLLNCLSQRRLLKRVLSVSNGPSKNRSDGDMGEVATIFPDATNRDALTNILKKEFRDKKTKLEKELAEVIRAKTNQTIIDDFVIVHTYSLKSVREQSRNNEGSILVYAHGAEHPGNFEEVSTVFNSINEELSEIYLDVYAPVCYDGDREKKELMNLLREPLLAVLREVR